MELVSRGRRQEPPLPPREHVPSLEPAIEEVILDLLADEPTDRPTSAVEMLAALPGGDPLAAALAAGETPSPEMVAAAPDRGVLSHRTAAAALVSVLLLLLCTHWLRPTQPARLRAAAKAAGSARRSSPERLARHWLAGRVL